MVNNDNRAALHSFAALHMDKDYTNETGVHDNELFFNCKFKKLNGLTLKDCDLNRSEFITDDIRDALGFTLTLNCMSFNHVQYSELLFDLLLLLLSKTKGNDEKREKLLDVVGRERANKLLRILNTLER
jgi:hypothetical protein